ncbi:hypothetical protein Ddc_13354 [Ditylenchus destructor]|nr:hypothetical protein Ddc_13354 [Ditylenchus destructor]
MRHCFIDKHKRWKDREMKALSNFCERESRYGKLTSKLNVETCQNELEHHGYHRTYDGVKAKICDWVKNRRLKRRSLEILDTEDKAKSHNEQTTLKDGKCTRTGNAEIHSHNNVLPKKSLRHICGTYKIKGVKLRLCSYSSSDHHKCDASKVPK